jgi:hypothetical protein
MAETADQAHAVKLAGLLLKTANSEHVAECREILILRKFRNRIGKGRPRCGLGGFRLGSGCGHAVAP